MGYSRGSLLMMILFSLGAVLAVHGIFQGDEGFEGIPILIVDEDESAFSEKMVELLSEEEYLRVSTGTMEEGTEGLKRNRLEGVYRIHEGFEEDILMDRIPGITAYTSSGALGAGAIGEVVASRGIRLISSSRAANLVLREVEEHSDSPREREILWQRIFERSEAYWEPEPLMTLQIREIDSSGDDSTISGEESRQVGLLSGPEGLLISYLSFFSAWVFYHRKKEWDSGVLPRQVLILGEKKLFMSRVYIDFGVIWGQSLLVFSFYRLLSDTADLKNLGLLFILLAGISLLWLGIWNLFISLKMNHQFLWSGIPIGILLFTIIGGGIWSVEVFPQSLQRTALFTPQGLFIEGYAMIRLNHYRELTGLMMIIFIFALCLLSLGFRRYKRITLPRS